MALIYTTGGYIIATDSASGLERPYPRKLCRYDENHDGFELIFDFHVNPPTISILFTDVATWTDRDAVPYTEATLRVFLQDNTAVGEIDTTGKEDESNKQNSRDEDGTGARYITVDAINEGVIGSDLYLFNNFT